MALPELRMPAGLPCFLVRGHAAQLLVPYDDIPQQGVARRRRVFTTMPREVDVQMVLEAAQAAALREWFEGPLEAGAQHFSAHVRNQGPGLRWWEAYWTQPYSLEAMAKGRYRMTGRLRLFGAPSEDPPGITTMRTSITVRVEGSSSLDVGRFMSTSITVEIGA